MNHTDETPGWRHNDHEHRCDRCLALWQHVRDCRRGIWLTCPPCGGEA